MSSFFYTKISLRADFTIDINVQVYSLETSAYFNGIKTVKRIFLQPFK